jgi:hypothetical protein
MTSQDWIRDRLPADPVPKLTAFSLARPTLPQFINRRNRNGESGKPVKPIIPLEVLDPEGPFLSPSS